MSMRRQISRIRKQSAVSARRPEAVTDPFRPGTSKAELGAGRGSRCSRATSSGIGSDRSRANRSSSRPQATAGSTAAWGFGGSGTACGFGGSSAACDFGGGGTLAGSGLVGGALAIVGAGLSTRLGSAGATAAAGRVAGSRAATAGGGTGAGSIFFAGGSGTSGMVAPPREP